MTPDVLPTDPQPCIVCRRRDCGFGVMKGGLKSRNPKTGWYCDDCGPALAQKAVAMSQREFDRAEQGAILQAGDEAGAFLDQIGKTDLATLTEDEWTQFLLTYTRAFGEKMRTALRNNEPPF